MKNLIAHSFILFLLVGCMGKTQQSYEYKVMTLQDIEADLYGKMQQAGIAAPVEGQPGKLRITDIEQAKSENSMPVVLNGLGKEGWTLVNINNSQLYTFARPAGQKKHESVEYKVLTLADLDKMIFDQLVADKAAEPTGEAGKYRILDMEKAKSQSIMPVVLNKLAEEGWNLSAVNKGNLYIFNQHGAGKDSFDKASANTADKKADAPKADDKKAADAKKGDDKKAADKKPAKKKEPAKKAADKKPATKKSDKK